VRFRRERDRRVILGPRPEPVMLEVYREILNAGYDIAAEFQRARHGVPEQEVKPLGIPIETLNDWVARLDVPKS
jgi:hypothetical protein